MLMQEEMAQNFPLNIFEYVKPKMYKERVRINE
jgi:hypothetical protein